RCSRCDFPWASFCTSSDLTNEVPFSEGAIQRACRFQKRIDFNIPSDDQPLVPSSASLTTCCYSPSWVAIFSEHGQSPCAHSTRPEIEEPPKVQKNKPRGHFARARSASGRY